MGDLISYQRLDASACSGRICPVLILTAMFYGTAGQKLSIHHSFRLSIGAAGHAVAIANESLLSNRYFLEVFLKLISVAFNLLILWIVWLEYRKQEDNKILLAALIGYGLNPGIIFNTSYWGQTDSISSFLILAALYLQKSPRKPELSALFAVAAVMAKPTVWPLALLIALAILKRDGIRRFAKASVLAATLFFVLLLPFILAGRFTEALQSLVVQIDASPYVSANAHNLWWIIQGGLPMIHVDTQFIGPLSYKEVGILLSGSFIAITIWKFWQSSSPNALYFAAASMAFGLFMLSTHMHENHLFMFFAVFAMIAFYRPNLMKFFYLASCVFLINMLLHDPYLNYMVHDSVPGPAIEFQPHAEDSPIAKTFIEEGKGYVLQERAGKITLIGYFLTLLNAQAALLLFILWLLNFYQTKSFDPALEEPQSTSLKFLPSAIAILLFVALTSFQFMMKVSRFL